MQPFGLSEKATEKQMLRITMIVITMIFTKLITNPSKVRRNKGREQAVF